ncbi:homolog to NAD(P)H dehydrogenase (quinone) [Halobacterium hubeiense]|uniref:Homolog to NAD(P)H dehydrogenase (Quinone) n=1 Tax=Halobacterium hubeiense TaxID=1407499 RepID=A0A0U5HA99_9EURY|nr:NAD(P)H-dependent oxidoreductase [Halobacterium hubeiense]CQH62213.1 homolog to NAD(P)H dehydrogenase (quinone) [Halobacterium hubeiense]
MEFTPLVVGVTGSQRATSYTRQAIEHALDAAERAGADTDHIDLGTADLPLYDPDRDLADAGDAEALLERVCAADAVVVGSPNYHSSYSSTFRNFHDYCGFDEYTDTPVGLVVVAGGGTIASPLDHLRVTMRGVHADVVAEQVGVRNASRYFEGGALTDDDLAQRLDDLASAVVDAAYRWELADREPRN